jgi:EXPERA (EXPanded EBP superfamily)
MPSATRILYLWHLIDGLTHLILEFTYVYNCFTSYTSIPPSSQPSHHSPRFFLGHPDRLYGNAYSDNIFAPLWMNYAKADSRYSGIDLTTLSLEIITVFLAGPLALYVAGCLRRGDGERISGGTWFWATVLASGEVYGGLMNFLPEWLSGCESLDTDDPVHFWFYIMFLNAIWLFFPMWVLRRAYLEMINMSNSKGRRNAGSTVAKGSGFER